MTSVRASVRLEMARLMLSRRWLIVVLICLGATVIAAETVAKSALAVKAEPSCWDVHATLVNNRETAVWFGCVALVVLAGNLVSDDRKSRFAVIVIPRLGSRVTWWTAKLVAVAVAAVTVQLLLVLLCLCLGAMHGWTLSPAASRFATSMWVDPNVRTLFPTTYHGGGIGHHVLMVGYLGLASTGLAAVVLALSVRFTAGVLPVLLTFVGLVADFLFLKQVNGWFPYSPSVRMLEGAHTSLVGPMALDWSTSLIYWGAVLISGALVGAWALQRADL